MSPGSASTGKWTDAEHKLFLQGIEENGRRWPKVSALVGTRTTAQVRSHAQKYFQRCARIDLVDSVARGPARGDDGGGGPYDDDEGAGAGGDACEVRGATSWAGSLESLMAAAETVAANSPSNARHHRAAKVMRFGDADPPKHVWTAAPPRVVLRN